jgi:hypothetical protein
LVLKVWNGECRPLQPANDWPPSLCPVFFSEARNRTPARSRFGTSPNSSDQQLRKARVIRDLAPLRENYLTRTSPTSAQLLPLSINKLPLFHQLLPPARRVFSRSQPLTNFTRFPQTTPTFKMTGGGKSGGKASGSKNAQS